MVTFQEPQNILLKWKEWIGIFIAETGNLLVSQDIFNQIQELANNNEKILVPNLYLNWIAENYVSHVVTVIRKLADKDTRTISLYRLIFEIKDHPEAIPRTFFVSRYQHFMRDNAAVRDYERYAEPDAPLLSPKKAQTDLDELTVVSEIVKTFVDKYIAHHDADQGKHPIPTFQDVSDVLKFIDQLVCKYNILIDGGGMPTTKPTINFDWKEPLRHAWLPLTDEEIQWRKEYKETTGEEYKPE